jgi:hypothetical protein
MSLERNDQRPTYRRSGRVAWLRFVPAAFGALLVAAAMAWCWSLLRDSGRSYWLATGALLAVPVAVAGVMAVAWGHCRNRWVAGTFGLAAAVVFHAGYFYASLIRLVGPEALLHPRALPDFIRLRVRFEPIPAAILAGGILDWFHLAAQFALILLIIGGLTVSRSLRAYCEQCHRWMRTILLHSESGKAWGIVRALESGELSTIPATLGRLGSPWPSSFVEFEYCPGLQEQGSKCNAYLTLKETTTVKEHPTVLMNQGQLRRDELDALAERLPALAWLRVSAAPAAEEQETFTPSIARYSGGMAAVERLTPDAGSTEFERTERFATLLSLVCLFVPLAGLSLLLWGWHCAPWLEPVDPAAALGWLLLAVGSIALVGGGYVCWINIDYLAQRHVHRWVRRVIANRLDALVPAEDQTAHCVNVVPRAQWHRLNSSKPTDRGLIRIEPGRRRMVFEGMKERYVIPADAVLSCRVERKLAQSDTINFFAVVVTVRYPDGSRPSLIGGLREGTWEIPFISRPTEFRRFNTAYRRALAESLRAEIEDKLLAKRRLD